MAAADIPETGLSGGIDADSGLALGLIHGTPRGKAAAGDRPLEIENPPPPSLNVFGCL